MPLTTDEKLLALSRETIAVFDKPMEVFTRASDPRMRRASCSEALLRLLRKPPR